MARIDSAGRLVLPARFRKKLGLKPGDEVTVVLEETSLRVMTTMEAIRRAQMLVRQYVSADRNLSQELSGERRREASRE